ncbi:MAG: hypothetical protein LKG79_11755 [Furfurilactobacillus sp.]|uniref:hypothetical protein n=1 Tax=Furfurilactobacillus sp. TaxID=2767911 RepID=UPI00258C1329|nr:hypothetical protein [Furfurilactobacillus sp.]MCH4011911.1 hypothetical protein [Furfurilactobacillus sp.]MCH4037803.1 hypothetical protein [Furfurilactobacillus sp.]MCH4115561.1 hypothetical protein [Furfurilactobacillus sp.]MCI1341431.1 hypothetical protein [Furfurilactobacillus sp.]MCI1388179.1 hypothetical protein [Furfurilactobacillus sp.]
MFWTIMHTNINVWILKDYGITVLTSIVPLLGVQNLSVSVQSTKKILRQVFSWATISLFVINFHTFSFGIEFGIIIPFIFTTSMLIATAETSEKYTLVVKTLNGLLMVIGLWLLLDGFIDIVKNLAMFGRLTTSLQFFMAIIVWFLHVPFLLFWHWINLIEAQMQFRKKHGFGAYLIDCKINPNAVRTKKISFL